MKKNKRTWLLLAGVAVLSATLLVPTVLSACSTTPNTENPGDTNNPGDGNDNNNGGTGGDGNTDQDPTPNKLADELKKLNDSVNVSARKNIYTDYFKDVNKTTSARSNTLTPPDLTKPTVTPLTEIIKKNDFFSDLITMINRGLDVGNSTQNGQISQSDLTSLITNLVNEKDKMSAQGSIANTNGTESTPGSIWSPNAFEFADVSTATWTYVSQDKNTVYELFLTENVDFNFESTVDKVSVKVSNKAGTDKTKSRLVVSTKNSGSPGAKTTTPSVTYESKTYNFKSDVNFALPPSLFDDFTKYIDAFDANVKKLKDYLPDATKKYKDLTSDSTKGFASAATLWNQFVSQNEESLLEAMKSDLNTNRSKSKIFKWIKANVSETASSSETTDTTLVGELQKDLEAAKNVNLDLDTLLIKGQNADNNGINNTDSEEPDYTLIISFDSEESATPPGQKTAANTEVTLDEKWYILNLKATGFEFENTVNQDFFGYQNSSFVTKPKLKLDAKSSFASYKLISTGDQVNGNDLATVQKLKNASLKNQNTSVDVSSLYDINGTGFTKFLSDLVINRQSESTKLTDKLLDLNANKNTTIIDKFDEYINNQANQTAIIDELRKPNVLADFILDNIDISNLALKSQKIQQSTSEHTPTDDLPEKNISFNDGSTKIESWRDAINFWVKGRGVNARPTITFKPNTPANNESFDGLSSKLKDKADITITSNRHNHILKNLKLGDNLDFEFKTIYIFFGSSTNQSNSVVSAIDNTVVNLTTASSGLYETNPGIDSTWDDILSKVENKFCILFEKAKSSSGTQTTKTPPVYAFYMGQQKVQTSKVSEVAQSKFSISLDSLLGDGSKFLEMLLQPSDSPSNQHVLTDTIIPRSFREIK